MVHQVALSLPHADSLVSVLAAIDVVAGGVASRVTVQTIGGEQILPASRALAAAAGVTLEAHWWADDAGRGIIISVDRPGGAH